MTATTLRLFRQLEREAMALVRSLTLADEIRQVILFIGDLIEAGPLKVDRDTLRIAMRLAPLGERLPPLGVDRYLRVDYDRPPDTCSIADSLGRRQPLYLREELFPRQGIVAIDLARTRDVEVLLPGEPKISGNDYLARLRQSGQTPLDLRVGQACVSSPDQAPPHFKDGRPRFLWGTILADKPGRQGELWEGLLPQEPNQYVGSLTWSERDHVFHLLFFPLNGYWHRGSLAPCLSPQEARLTEATIAAA